LPSGIANGPVRVKRINFFDSKLGPTIALFVEKGIIALFRDVDSYSEVIKVRVPACTLSEYVLPPPSHSFQFKKNLRGLDVTELINLGARPG